MTIINRKPSIHMNPISYQHSWIISSLSSTHRNNSKTSIFLNLLKENVDINIKKKKNTQNCFSLRLGKGGGLNHKNSMPSTSNNKKKHPNAWWNYVMKRTKVQTQIGNTNYTVVDGEAIVLPSEISSQMSYNRTHAHVLSMP